MDPATSPLPTDIYQLKIIQAYSKLPVTVAVTRRQFVGIVQFN
jgi:hypothetical protein